jgi:hypothetical protein
MHHALNIIVSSSLEAHQCNEDIVVKSSNAVNLKWSQRHASNRVFNDGIIIKS